MIACHLDTLPHRERGAYIGRQAEMLGVSASTLYRRLEKQAAWSSGRKTRADCGASRVSLDEATTIAALKRETMRQNGKRLMSTQLAAQLAREGGLNVAASTSSVDRVLRQRGLTAERIDRPTPAIEQRSLHPNHVMMVDPSLCLVYYVRGKQSVIDEREFYKNKLDKIAEIKDKVWRYVAADHYSNTIIFRYYAARGENQQSLFEFLMYAWAQQPERTAHGVPMILMMDAGSANTARAIENLCKSLSVELIINEPGNPRAKGGVEKAQDMIERNFESLLRLQAFDGVEALNAHAHQWQELFNCNMLPGLDLRLMRQGLREKAVRTDLWLTIKPEQLRACPPVALCAYLMQGATQTRTVDGRMRITYQHPARKEKLIYDLRGVSAIQPRDKVEVLPIAYGTAGEVIVRVRDYKGEIVEHVIAPIMDWTAAGFRESSPIIGQEYKALPKTDMERATEALERAAYGIDADGQVRDRDAIADARKRRERPFAHLNEGNGLRPFDTLHGHDHRLNIPRRSTALEVDLPQVIGAIERSNEDAKRASGYAHGTANQYHGAAEHVYTVVQAAQLLRDRAGEAWDGGWFTRLADAYPQGVPESQLDNALAMLKRATLKVVGE